MAIYHLEAKVVSRGAGRSAVAAAAYMICSRLYNDYDGVQHDYTLKGGLIWQQVFLPDHAPPEWQDREILWNAVEAEEKTKDSRLAREFVVALPVELNKDAWVDLLSEFLRAQFVSEGMCADVAIHDTDGHNPHAHILLTVRPLNPDGTWQNKTEKEYLCIQDHREQGFTAAEFKQAKTEGWEKQYLYQVGDEHLYLSPSRAAEQGFKRLSKYPYSTKYGRQNPITARWNSEEQLTAWRASWAEAVNLALERSSVDQGIDHRSHTERGLDEKPTIHEGPSARKMEKAGYVAERCEINRQIKADNALIRSLKAAIKTLTEAVKDTVSSIAAAMETVRESMMVLHFGLLRIRKQRSDANEYLSKAKPMYSSYIDLSKQIKEKRAEKASLQKKLDELPLLSVRKRRDLNAQIQTFSEDLSELENEAMTIVHGFGKDTPDEVKAVNSDIADTEKDLKRYDHQETEVTAAIDRSKAESDGLQERAMQFDRDELTAERLAIRPGHEARAKQRMKDAVPSGKLGLWDFQDAARNTDRFLGEENLADDFT